MNHIVSQNSQTQAPQISRDVAAIHWLDDNDLTALAEAGVKTLDDLADLASDELLEITGTANLNQDRADQVIMAARAHWFDTKK
jgi:N utilization substance protein A